MMIKPDLSTQPWGSEQGPATAVFIGWLDRDFQSTSTVDPVFLSSLIKLFFSEKRERYIRNIERCINLCPICNATVYLDSKGKFFASFTDAQELATRKSLVEGSLDWDVLGHAEFWVPKDDGSYYVSPSLLLHYIETHNYVPPQEYIDRVIELALLK